MENEITPNLSTNDLILSPQGMANISQFAEFMSTAQVMIPDHLKGKPADCAAIVMQSLQWGMNPYVVSQKTHLVSGTLGYEAQLVNAVISSSTAIQGRFHYEYSDDEGWDKLAGMVAVEPVEKKGRNNSTYTVNQPVAKWTPEDEKGLWIKVGARLAGEDKITWGEKLFLSQVLTRNSPLWVTAVRQQIAYLGVKYWSRLYTPDVIMGVYTVDEIPSQGFENAKDITPEPDPGAKPESSLRKPKPAEDIEIDDADTSDAIMVNLSADDIDAALDDDGADDHDESDPAIPTMNLDQVIQLLTDAASRDELEKVMIKVVAQNTFIKGTEEHDKIKAKRKAKNQYFTNQERRAASDEGANAKHTGN